MDTIFQQLPIQTHHGRIYRVTDFQMFDVSLVADPMPGMEIKTSMEHDEIVIDKYDRAMKLLEI